MRAAYEQLLEENRADAGPKSLDAVAQSPLAARKKGGGNGDEEATAPTRSELPVEVGESGEEIASEELEREDAKG